MVKNKLFEDIKVFAVVFIVPKNGVSVLQILEIPSWI